jgi:hypothetical protein
MWKDVVGYEGLYEVSDSGEVRSRDRYIKTDIRHVKSRLIKGKILFQNLKPNGYKTVDLCKDGKVKTTLVHRIVAEAFLPNPDGLRFVNHKDSNRANNIVSNLEWVTSSENRKHGITNGFVTFRGTPILCKETGQIFERPLIAAEWVKETYPDRINGTMKVAAHNIGSACKGRTPKAYGFTWIYHEGSTTIPEGSRGKRPEMGDPSNIEGEDIV